MPRRTDEDGGHVIRRAHEDDWADLRAIRVAALADSPTAFASTLARELHRDEADWRAWARDTPTYIAFCGKDPIGIAACIEGDRDRERQLIAMWVRPDQRRSGVASALVDAVRAWALDDGADRLTLWVTRTNGSAATLYRRRGFRATGLSQPLPSNVTLVEDEYVLDLH